MSQALAAADADVPGGAMLHTAFAFIEAHLHDTDLAPSDVAKALGVSRATLYRIFEPLGGVSSQMKRLRLLRAWRLLASGPSRRKIAEIASQVGFLSATHFSREFRRLFGIPPRAVLAE